MAMKKKKKNTKKEEKPSESESPIILHLDLTPKDNNTNEAEDNQ